MFILLGLMRRPFSVPLAASFLVSILFSSGSVSAQTPPPITRAGAIALMVEANPVLKARAQWFDGHMPPIPLFYDIDQKQWYAPYLEAAFEAGIVTGSDENREFRPGDLLKVEEAIAFVNRAKHAQPVAAQTGTWYETAVATANANGVVLPAEIYIGQPITRADLHAMYASIGLSNTANVALSIRVKPPAPAPVIAAATPRPTQPAQPRVQPSQPRPQQPVATQPRVTQPQPVAPRPVAPAPRIVVNPAPAPAPAPASAQNNPNASSKFFSITIPAAGIKDLTITHPSNPSTSQGLLAVLQSGVGHLFSYPGKGGKILIYGHSSAYPWDVSAYTKIFRQINKLNAGDKIYVTYNGKLYTYQVTHESVVPASDTSAYRGGGSEELILYTCWPPDDIKQRYLVHAKPVETVALK